MNTQEGMILSNDEYKKILNGSRIFELTEAARNLRVIFYNNEKVMRGSEKLFKTK
jgi:hypothetical protein